MTRKDLFNNVNKNFLLYSLNVTQMCSEAQELGTLEVIGISQHMHMSINKIGTKTFVNLAGIFFCVWLEKQLNNMKRLINEAHFAVSSGLT